MQSKQGITATDVVLGILCPPALVANLAIEAAAIKAKERKERKEREDIRTDADIRSDRIFFCIMAVIGLLAVVAKIMGYDA